MVDYMDKQELLTMGFVFLAIFILAFSFTSWLNSQNAVLFGFRIMADKPAVEALKEVFNKDRPLVLKQELTRAISRENSAVAAMSAELVYAAVFAGTPVYNYGAVNGDPVNSTCNLNNSFCGPPDIVISVDASSQPCNCIRVYSNKTMEIRGSSDFLLTNAVNIRKVVFLAKTK